jgi:hypothetical protein
MFSNYLHMIIDRPFDEQDSSTVELSKFVWIFLAVRNLFPAKLQRLLHNFSGMAEDRRDSSSARHRSFFLELFHFDGFSLTIVYSTANTE